MCFVAALSVLMRFVLQAATGQFGCDILISEFVYTLMSDGVKSRLRRLDRLTVKGSKVVGCSVEWWGTMVLC